MTRKSVFSLILLLTLTSQIPVFAQSGILEGVVVDKASQERLPAATVQVLGTTLGASTDLEGKFSIQDIPVGTYQVRVSLVGYEPLVLSDIVVTVARPAELVLKLHQTDIDLEGVEVLASYFQRNPDAPVSLQTLSYEEIRRSPGGFEDILRAISVLPGVAQVQNGRNDLVVRGGAPSENLYTIDNIEIPNINHFGTQGAAGGPLSYVNLDFVRETSFSTGGFGARYGDKLSSVLNIDLRDGRSDRLGGKATVAATQFGLNLEGPIDKSGSFVFSARRSYLDIIFKSAGFSFVPEYWDFLGRVSYKLDQQNELTFLAIGAIDDVNFFYRDAEDAYNNSRILGTAQNQYASGFTLRHLFSSGFATFTLGRSFISYDGVQRDSLLNPIFTNRSEEGETSLKGDVVMKLTPHTEFSFGAQARRVTFDGNLALPGFSTSFGETLSVQVQDYRSTGTKSAAYAQLSHHVWDRLVLTLGGRLDFFDLLETKFYAAPRASVAYEWTPLTTITASAGVYYQSPSSIWLVANPDNRRMKATRADQYILGVEHLLRTDFKVRLEGFLKEYGNYPASVDRPYLVLANTGGGFGGAEDNFASFGLDPLVSEGTGRSYGVELLLQKKLSEIPLYGLASVTLSRNAFTALDGIERSGAYDQQVILNLTAGYQFDERWEASMKFRFATGRPYTPFTSTGTQNVSEYNSLRVDAGHGLDIRVDRRWNFSSWNLIAYVDIQNIYNNKGSGTVRWNAREQRVESNENAIGILPSIGVSAEF
jgi:hypothetical protein